MLAYSFFRPGATPGGLPARAGSSLRSQQPEHAAAAEGSEEAARRAVHIHHKFIIIDAETDTPTIYGLCQSQQQLDPQERREFARDQGQPGIGANRFRGIPASLRALPRAGALEPPGAGQRGQAPHERAIEEKRSPPPSPTPLRSSRSRNAWAKGAYTPGTPEFRARTQLAGE